MNGASFLRLKKTAFPLFIIIKFIVNCVLLIWVWTLKPHQLCFKKMGIRVVFTAAKDRASEHDVYLSLIMLRQYEEDLFCLLKRHVKTIFLLPIAGPGQYMGVGRICLLSPSSIPEECPEGTRPIAIAGLLAYLVTSASLKLENCKEELIHDLSWAEQTRVVKELSESLCL